MTAASTAEIAHEHRRADVLPLVLAGAGLALSALAVAVVLVSGQPGDELLVAFAGVLVIAVPVSIGAAVWRAKEYERFGRLLVVLGFLGLLPVLAHSSDSVVYSLGRTGVWVIEPVAIAALLAFPSGRLKGTIERAIALVMVATVVVLYFPTALLVERYPEPSLWATCRTSCPGNAFMVVGREPAFVDAWVRPVRELLTIGVYVAVVAVLSRRLYAATDLEKLMVAPALGLAILRSLAMAGGLALRRVDPALGAVDAVAWIFVLCLPAIAVAFLVGLVRSRLFVGSALQRLSLRLRSPMDSGDLRGVLASALGDPSLEVAYWAPGPPGRWLDAAGKKMELPAGRPDRSVTEVREQGRQVAAFVHDPALDQQRAFVEAAGGFALASLENQRLKARVEASLESLRESRARLQAAADGERRRIERDLHDGAQQRLVALRVRLELAADAVREDPERGSALLHRLGEEVEDALDDVRSLAGGIYPSLLADQGLPDALGAAVRRSAVPATFTSRGVGRYPPALESAIYFCCLEALQNASKHAEGATSVAISIVDDGVLRFQVNDDGAGFDVDSTAPGSGLTNMRDRIGAAGGELWIVSAVDGGTKVAGAVPIR